MPNDEISRELAEEKITTKFKPLELKSLKSIWKIQFKTRITSLTICQKTTIPMS
jgi:hypothetical protein